MWGPSKGYEIPTIGILGGLIRRGSIKLITSHGPHSGLMAHLIKGIIRWEVTRCVPCVKLLVVLNGEPWGIQGLCEA